MTDKRAYFISDLHLGASYEEDTRRRERMAVDFLRSIRRDASHLFLVGDILDYWFEYKTVVPRGYVRFFGALAELADAGVKITWLIGNHDIWLFGYLKSEIGLTVVDGVLQTEILGSRFYISHGDGLGRLPCSFRFIRSVFRNRVCQKMYSAIHPRWTIPFAHRWSSHSRKNERPYQLAPGQEDPLVTYSREILAQNPTINYFVYGHRHIVLDEKLAETSRVVILGDWLTHFSYGVFDGAQMRIERYATSAGEDKKSIQE